MLKLTPKQIEALHGGKISLKHDDEEIGYLTGYVENNPYDQFFWKRTSYTKTKETWTFKGRRYDEIALVSKEDRPKLLADRGLTTYNEYDIKAAVPSLHLLLNTGKWLGTSETEHIRKDITLQCGINLPETPDDKNITFRWLFEPTLDSALAHWERYKRRNKSHTFTYTREQFIKGWGLMQRKLYPENRTAINLKSNYGYQLSFSIFWWESLLEYWVCKALRGRGYLTENAYDNFYSKASVILIKRTIDIMATKLYIKYQSEMKKNASWLSSLSLGSSPGSWVSPLSVSICPFCPTFRGVYGWHPVSSMSDKRDIQDPREVRKRMRTQEQKQTDKERKRAKRNGKPRKAVILEGKLFKNQKEAAEHFGVNVKTIKRRIKKDDVE